MRPKIAAIDRILPVVPALLLTALPALLSVLVLATAPRAAAGEPVNYCHDPKVNQHWGKLVEESPGDDILMRLFALRLGLRQLVDGQEGLLDEILHLVRQPG
jgi:hypothetical protein